MKRWTSRSCAGVRVVLVGASIVLSGARAPGQNRSSPKVAVLLGRARTSEQRGRLDQAAQDWVEVLRLDPNDAEALAGLVRSARAAGRTTEAEYYLARLRGSHPGAPELAQLEAVSNGAGQSGDRATELAEAGRLMQAGDNAGAMAIYRRLYGTNPPPGPEAVAYFEAEARTPGGRPHAVAGLRALADRYPGEPRYAIALGRVLLSEPRTEAEGRMLLGRYPQDTAAVAASDRRQGDSAARAAVPAPSPAVPSRAATAPQASREETVRAETEAGFAALNAHRPDEAEARFRAVLAKHPTEPRALAGMGYLRLQADDLYAALNYFVQAQAKGDHSLALARTLINTQFALLLQRAESARAAGDLRGAEAHYRAALQQRPSDAEALEGLGAMLVQAGRNGEAVALYTRLTEVRPLSPAAWRGLILAEAGAGQNSAVLVAETREPAAVREPLAHDPIYLEAVRHAREAGSGTPLEIAKRHQDALEAEAAAHRLPPPLPKPGAPAPGAAAEPVEQGRLALGRGDNARAVALFREAVARRPTGSDGWRGLLLALYAEGHEAEAVAVADETPGPVWEQLGGDATFQAAVAAVYLKANRPDEALHAFAQAQNVFVTQKLPPPVFLMMRLAALLAAREDTRNLYGELVYLGTRMDLSQAQRREVQRIWAGWAVRQARATALGGDQARAVALLNAAAEAFPGNREVVYAVADGYAGVGLPAEATALYKAQDLATATAPELAQVIRAALAARDWRAAAGWLRLARSRFPGEPAFLTLAAELEQERGHQDRAVALSAQAKALAPAEDPLRLLASALREARAGGGSSGGDAGQLATLLEPAEGLRLANGGTGASLPSVPDRPAKTPLGTKTPMVLGYDEPSR